MLGFFPGGFSPDVFFLFFVMLLLVGESVWLMYYVKGTWVVEVIGVTRVHLGLSLFLRICDIFFLYHAGLVISVFAPLLSLSIHLYLEFVCT